MSNESTKTNQITEGVIWKQLLIFFFPIVVGTLFQQLYNTVDAVIVGRFVGKGALAAVGGSSAVLSNLIIGCFTGLASGASVIVSQFYGAKDERNLQKSLHTAYAFSVILSIVFTILGWALTPFLLKLIDTPADTLADSILYLRIYFLGIFGTLIFNIGSAVMRSIGDSRRPLYYLIVCCFLNIILDLVLVIVFDMGIVGAAIATIISQAVSAILVTNALMKKYGEPLTLYIDGYLHDVHEAEELMLDVFAYLFTKKPKVRDGGFKAYLYKAARHMALRHKSKRKSLFSLDALADEPDGRLLAEEVIRTEERNRVLHFCMGEMNPDYREVLYLTYFEDMSYAQAAEVTGKTVKQITNMVYRGKESLRRLLEREGITNAES